METKIETEYPSSPANDASDDEDRDGEYPDLNEDQQEGAEEQNPDHCSEEEYEEDSKPEQDFKVTKQIPLNCNVANILKRLQSVGAVIKKPKEEYKCFTCDIKFEDWEELENHLIQHVSLPSVVLDKLPSDEEDTAPSGDENWSDDEEIPETAKQKVQKTPQKIDISQILKKTGISLKKASDNDSKANSSDSALSKLSGLGFTIKKNSTPIKKEPDSEQQSDVMQKLGKLGGIKLKLKSDGNNGNSFKVVNGLKDFKASDDEDEGSGNEQLKEEDESMEDEKNEEKEGSDAEHENEEVEEEEEQEPEPEPVVKKRKKSDSDEEQQETRITRKVANVKGKPVQRKLVTPKTEPPNTPAKKVVQAAPVKEAPQRKPPGRPAVKQTPKRGPNHPTAAKEPPKQVIEPPQGRRGSTPRRESTPRRDSVTTSAPRRDSATTSSTPERSESRESNVENVVVKQETEDGTPQTSNMPLFSGQIKSERASPPLNDMSTPIIARVKADPDGPQSNAQSNYNAPHALPSTLTTPLLPVTKTEDTGVTIIEINGDSNDEDDDCCVVSATPATDVKPVIPKTETLPPPPPYVAPSSYSASKPSYTSGPSLSSRLTPSTEKQHNFNWNAPDSKPPIDMLEKSADEIFESLLSSATKKESMSSLSDASEYISLDTLGPQHSCDICNTRFTDISLLEDHRRLTGHSKSLVAPSSSTLLPYSSSSNILSSLLPVKQLAEQVGKLSTINSAGPGFTHQQNVMINIQAYPGAGGVMVPPQSYNSYAPGQNMHPGYPQTSNNMYGSAGQMPGQYQGVPGQNYMGQGYGQYQPPMSKAGYPGSIPPNTYSSASSPYSSASPLQSMQQSVYGQASTGLMGPQPGQMGPPGMGSPSHPYNPASSPGGTMKPPTSSGVRIQNVQTFPPGQLLGGPGLAPGQTMPPTSDMNPGQMTAPGQPVGGQMPPPTQIRMAANANVTGTRPRMPTVRGQRPTIRPGIQVHGQVRGAGKQGPRMPMKRPGGMVGGPGQQNRRRPDMLLPGKHDNEDCQVMAMQKQREGLPMIQSVQGAKDKLNLGGQISITKKTVNKEANAMANVLASRGISVKQKAKSRSPTPERPVPHIPNLGAGMSIKHTSKSSNFSIPEAKVGGGMLACKICKKMFMNYNSLNVHMSNAHPQSKIPIFKCDECPASYPKSLQLQHHKRVFHNVTGPNRELGLPVVDLSQEDNLKRLSNLGIYSFIPLANREQASGCFGIPVVSVHNMQNGMTAGLQALGADGLLSLGPLKPLPNS
ncbi:uncharacterized protein [Epargyreus clarus]|uniref:uncharacterized protein n=1 Tax=Epargyreus clarus TaxID=520877 RepID=UPI003C2CEAF9